MNTNFKTKHAHAAREGVRGAARAEEVAAAVRTPCPDATAGPRRACVAWPAQIRVRRRDVRPGQRRPSRPRRTAASDRWPGSSPERRPPCAAAAAVRRTAGVEEAAGVVRPPCLRPCSLLARQRTRLSEPVYIARIPASERIPRRTGIAVLWHTYPGRHVGQRRARRGIEARGAAHHPIVICTRVPTPQICQECTQILNKKTVVE